MIRFGLKNLRRLVSVDPVDIKPITILVGRNSSGKSSFLRAFPLVRQSLLTRTSSPILWYGDLVDFGSFRGSVTDNNDAQAISFTFGVDRLFLARPRRYGGWYTSSDDQPFDVTLEVSVGLEPDPSVSTPAERSQISALRLTVKEWGAEFCITNSGGEIDAFTLDGEDIRDYFSEYRFALTQGTIFPELLMRRVEPKIDRPYYNESGLLLGAMGKALRPYLHGRIKTETLNNYAAELLVLREFTKENLAYLAATVSAAQSFKTFLSNVAERDPYDIIFRTLLKIYRASRFPYILESLSQHLRDTISTTLYIGPARARSERYYRYQDLAVSEIDPNGTNFPMFLSSLRPDQLSGLSDWVERLYKYRIELERSSGHLSINLVEGDHSINIVDTGYGVSQILPVLGQIWWAAYRPQSRTVRPRREFADRTSIMAIEQPELHLHPAHQSLLADALAAQTSDSTADRLYFIVETHSETLINRLGELIATGQLRPEMVQILIFQPSPENERATDVRVARFGESGELIDWPYGFFQPASN